MTVPNRMIWLDVETTGLSNAALLLEVGVVVTDNDLFVLGNREYLVKYDNPSVLRGLADNDIVVQMHDKSKLWMDLIFETTHWARDIEDYLIDFLTHDMKIEKGTVPMCGSSVGFDRRILMGSMPKLEAFFHYRSIDVSSDKELVARWRPDLVEKLAASGQKQERHRCVSDCLDSIAELSFYRSNFFRMVPDV